MADSPIKLFVSPVEAIDSAMESNYESQVSEDRPEYHHDYINQESSAEPLAPSWYFDQAAEPPTSPKREPKKVLKKHSERFAEKAPKPKLQRTTQTLVAAEPKPPEPVLKIAKAEEIAPTKGIAQVQQPLGASVSSSSAVLAVAAQENLSTGLIVSPVIAAMPVFGAYVFEGLEPVDFNSFSNVFRSSGNDEKDFQNVPVLSVPSLGALLLFAQPVLNLPDARGISAPFDVKISPHSIQFVFPLPLPVADLPVSTSGSPEEASLLREVEKEKEKTFVPDVSTDSLSSPVEISAVLLTTPDMSLPSSDKNISMSLFVFFDPVLPEGQSQPILAWDPAMVNRREIKNGIVVSEPARSRLAEASVERSSHSGSSKDSKQGDGNNKDGGKDGSSQEDNNFSNSSSNFLASSDSIEKNPSELKA